MNKKLQLLLIVFCLGYVANDIVSKIGFLNFPKAHAEVAGMDSYDLKSDYDFKKAVKSVVDEYYIKGIIDDYYIEDIVDDCTVSGGYVDGDYVSGLSLNC